MSQFLARLFLMPLMRQSPILKGFKSKHLQLSLIFCTFALQNYRKCSIYLPTANLKNKENYD